MNISSNSAFVGSRKNIDTVGQLQLAEDLINAAWQNYRNSEYNLTTYRYHFHIINSRDIAVTVKLSKYNNISVRGKIVNKLDDLFVMIESIKD